MNRHGDKKNTKKKHLKFGCTQNTFQALSKPYVLLKACLGFQNGMLGPNIAPPKHLRATAPLPHASCSVHASERFEHGEVEVVQLTSVQSPVCVKHHMNESHLTAADSPAFLPLFIFLLMTKVGITTFLVYANEISTAIQKICRSNLQFNCHLYGFKRQGILNPLAHL